MKAFREYHVIGFIIQVHDFNFPLFLSKAGGAAGGSLVVCWITAYEMSFSTPSQCLDDIIGMEMCRVSSHFNSSFKKLNPQAYIVYKNLFDIISLIPQNPLAILCPANYTQSYRQRKKVSLCKAA